MNFYMPTRLFTGEGAVAAHADELAGLGSRCLIVTSGHAAKASGALADVEAALDATGVAHAIWDGITENPPVAACAEAGRVAVEQGAEFVVGIGGGSPLDAAKAVAVFAANPTLDEDELYAKAWDATPLPIVLVGTTAGTGSEVTKVSVLTDAAGRKHSIHDDLIYARLALGDARYTASCGHATTLSCGVDVLAHATESYFSHKADDISRAFATRAVRLLVGPLTAAAEGASLTDVQRTQLYDASILGGLAINTTGTCFPHNVGYYLTEAHHVPHGFACAVFLPEMLRRVQKHDPTYAADFYSAAGTTEAALVDLITACLPALDIHLTEETVDAILPRWEHNASVENTLAPVTTTDIRGMLLELFR